MPSHPPTTPAAAVSNTDILQDRLPKTPTVRNTLSRIEGDKKTEMAQIMTEILRLYASIEANLTVFAMRRGICMIDKHITVDSPDEVDLAQWMSREGAAQKALSEMEDRLCPEDKKQFREKSEPLFERLAQIVLQLDSIFQSR